MAERPVTVVTRDGGPTVVTWETLANNDTGKPANIATHSDRTVQVLGTFGSATMTLQGSNDGGTTWAGLHDAQGVVIAMTAAGIALIADNPVLIRPSVAGGGGTTDLDVIISAV